MRKKFLIPLFVGILLLVVSLPAMAEVSIFGGGTTDISGYLSLVGNFNYRIPMADSALEFGVVGGGNSYGGFVGALANILYGYDPDESSFYVVSGVGVVNLMYEETEGACFGVNIGVGHTIGALDLRFESPLLFTEDGVTPVILFLAGVHF